MPGRVALTVDRPLSTKQTSAANTAQVLTLTAVPHQKISLRAIILYSSAAGSATVTVQDGATVVLDYGTISLTTAATVLSLGSLGLWGSTGNNVVINIGAAGVGVTTTLSVVADGV